MNRTYPSTTRSFKYSFMERNKGILTGKWLDIGSGGLQLDVLHNPGMELVRADINPATHPDVIMDATKEFPFPDDHFDGIISLSMLEHLEEPGAFFKECRRVLKKEGYLLLQTPFLYPYHGTENCGDYVRWTHQKMEKEAKNFFDDVEVHRQGGRYSLLLEITNLSLPPFARWVLLPARPIMRWLDNNLLSPAEKKRGKSFYLAIFLKARK